MPVVDAVVGISGVIALVATIPVLLAAFWVRVFRRPAGKRRRSLIVAIVDTLVVVILLAILIVLDPGGLPDVAQGVYGLGYNMPLSFRLVYIVVFIASLVFLGSELQLLARAKRRLRWRKRRAETMGEIEGVAAARSQGAERERHVPM